MYFLTFRLGFEESMPGALYILNKYLQREKVKGRRQDRREEDNLSICSLLHRPHSQVSTTQIDLLSLETSLNEHFIKRGLSSV